MGGFRDWPSKVVVDGTGQDTNTYIGYSPLAGAQLAAPVWVVERVSEDGANDFAVDCLEPNESEPQPKAAMDDPDGLDFATREDEEGS